MKMHARTRRQGGPSRSTDKSSSPFSLARESLTSSLWFTPSLFMAAAIAAALLLAAADRELAQRPAGEELLLAFSGGPEAARAILGTIAGSILTLTALVFSITVLVLQLTSSQYSPRALRTFLRDGMSKVTMGVFLGTFTFALLSLREVRGGSSGADAFVPGLLVTGALILTLASLYMFLFYIHHISLRIQATSIIATIADESIHHLDRLYPDAFGSSEPDPLAAEMGEALQIVSSREANPIVSIDEQGLVRLAEEEDACLEMLVGVGHFAVQGQNLVGVHGSAIRDEERLLKHVHFGENRNMEQDLLFGFRQIVDIAVRALSPGVNDPSTAIQALDRLHDLLRRLGQRDFPLRVHRDDQGNARLIMLPQTWESFVRLTVEEIVYYGGEAPEVRHRLRRMYDDLVRTLPRERAKVIRVVAEDTGWI